jgi:hypothetical protein
MFGVYIRTSTPQQSGKTQQELNKKWRQPHSPGHSRHKSVVPDCLFMQNSSNKERTHVSLRPRFFSFLFNVFHSLFVSFKNQLKFQSAGLDTQLYALPWPIFLMHDVYISTRRNRVLLVYLLRYKAIYADSYQNDRETHFGTVRHAPS